MAGRKVLISARGVAAPYCYIQKPDYGSGEFKNDRGQYKVVLTIPNSDPRCQAMINEIVAAHEENYEKVVAEFKENPPKAKPGKKVLQPYEGDMPFFDNEDGTTSFTFKSHGDFKDKKTGETIKRIIAVFDGRGKKLPVVPAISGGSELKIKYTLFPYGFSTVAGASVKLQLDSVMLLKLVEYGAGGDSDWGDEVEEDGEDFSGYQAREESQEESQEDDSEEESEEEDNDF